MRLFGRFILRNLAREKTRTVIAVLGIALGVAVMVAVRLANTSVVDSFRAATDAIGGAASLRITGVAGRFDERLLRKAGWLRDFGSVSPVIDAYALLEAGPQEGTQELTLGEAPTGEFLQVLGVDALSDLPLRRYRLLRTNANDREPNARELLDSLTDPHAIVVTQKLARRLGKGIGDRLALVFGSTRHEFTIRGLLLDEGPARTLDGNFVLLDIAAAQWVTDRLGLLDRVDIKLNDGIDADQAMARIAERLPDGLRVEYPQDQYGRVETMISAFQFNLAALSAVALLVGLFLIYNTVSISVLARREEIGILQAVGSGRRKVLALFLGEALLLASVGTVLGLGAGVWLAEWAVRATATTVETFYIAEVASNSARATTLAPREAVLAAAIALPLALLAAALPAWEAASVRPADIVRGADRSVRSLRPPSRHLALAGGFGSLACLLGMAPPIGGLPVCGFLAELAIMFGGAFLVPMLLWAACRIVRGRWARLVPAFRVERDLAGANLAGAIPRISISVAALGVSLAMMVAISIMVGSFRETVVGWLGQTLKADLYVKPVTLTSGVSDALLDEQAVEILRADPAVESVGWFSSRQVAYRGSRIRLGATDFADVLESGRLLFKEPTDRAILRRDLGPENVILSESFSLRYGIGPGDDVELPTATGMRAFRVAGVYYDYSSNQGTVVLDGSAFARHVEGADEAPQPSSLALYLRPGEDVDRVRSRLLAAVGARQRLFIVGNDNLRGEALRIFDSTFTITYALEVIAVLVAGLGVVATLATLIYERQREIALLRLVGATRKQIRRMVVIEALTIGAVSQIIGIVIGILLAVVLVYVVNVQSYGWTIRFRLPIDFLIQSTFAILAVTAACGLYPATRAADVDAVRLVREE